MKTKSFSNGWGSKELTKDEFVRYWVETTFQYSKLFYQLDKGEELLSFQADLEDAAAKAWDLQA